MIFTHDTITVLSSLCMKKEILLLSGRETKVIQPTVLQIVFNRVTEFFDFLPIRFTSRRVYCRRVSVILRYSILIKWAIINLACVASVSVWFQSKERQRIGIFGFGRARNWQTSGQKLNQGEGGGGRGKEPKNYMTGIKWHKRNISA